MPHRMGDITALELISSICASVNVAIWDEVQGLPLAKGGFPWQAAQRSNTPE